MQIESLRLEASALMSIIAAASFLTIFLMAVDWLGNLWSLLVDQ